MKLSLSKKDKAPVDWNTVIIENRQNKICLDYGEGTLSTKLELLWEYAMLFGSMLDIFAGQLVLIL
jgi:hypothetical protein